MKLTDEQLKNALLKILEFNPMCPICSGRDFEHANDGYMLIAPNELENKKFDLGKDVSLLPLLPIICKKCGYTMLFNSTVLTK